MSIALCSLNSHFQLDGRVGIVADDLEVVESKVVDVRDLAFDSQLWEWTRLALELLLQRLNVVQVDVRVAE